MASFTRYTEKSRSPRIRYMIKVYLAVYVFLDILYKIKLYNGRLKYKLWPFDTHVSQTRMSMTSLERFCFIF